MALASLMVSASPADLQVYLVDLKNEDLIALAGFPHVRGVARDLPAAVDLVKRVAAIKDQRVAAGVVGSAPLVVLAIDEYAAGISTPCSPANYRRAITPSSANAGSKAKAMV